MNRKILVATASTVAIGLALTGCGLQQPGGGSGGGDAGT